MNLTSFTIKKIHQGLVKKEFSALELCRSYFDKIQKDNKEVFAFLNLSQDLALSQAKAVDNMIKEGKSISELAGAPLAVKDNILVEGVKCTAGSKILENYLAPYDATVIKKIKEKGGIILGKANLDEFAMGSSTENSAFGPTKNPHDLTRVPGGSSGGPAAAVSADMSAYALGSDTGSSVRLPAAFCGLVGLKPTYGSVSRYGLIAMASSLDQIGPITKNVDDARVVFNAIKGYDEMDSTSTKQKPKSNRLKNVKGLRLGIPKEYFEQKMDPEIKKIIKEVVKKYESLGAEIKEISLPHCTDYSLAVYYIIVPCEVSANLARYDGIKYGFKANSKVKNLSDVYFQSRGQGFGPEVRRRVMLGTYALSSGYYETYYLRAQKVRVKIKEDFKKAFEKVDVILTPSSSSPAFKIGEKKDPLSMYLMDIFMTAVNLAGLPAISLPCGKVEGLPIGFQLIGNAFEEELILNVAETYEQSK